MNSTSLPKDTQRVKDFSLSRGIRWVLMIIFTLLYVILMFNVGIFTAAITQIKKDLSLEDNQYGLLGSYNGGGKIIGTLIFLLIVNKYNRKYILIIPLFISSISIYLFTIFENRYILYLLRGINGICQVFGFIYFPIWIDQFGIQKRKTLMMTLIQLAAPFGMAGGYLINYLIESKNWRSGFIIEFIGECGLLFLILFFPRIYFSRNIYYKSDGDSRKNKRTKINDELFDNDKKELFLKAGKGLDSIFYAEAKKSQLTGSFFSNVISLLKNKLFMFAVLYKSTTQFICAGIGYWIADFLENVLEEKNERVKFQSYLIIIIGGPLIGMVIGGFLGSLTGGYEKKASIVLIFIFQFIASIIGIFVIFCDTANAFNIVIGTFFIFNSAAVPINSGFILWSVPKEMKGLANGVSNLIVTFLGKFPAPYLYGLINKISREQNLNKKNGMIFLMSIAFVGDVFLLLAAIFRALIKDNDTNIKTVKESFVDIMRNSINDVVTDDINYNNNNYNNIVINEEDETINYLDNDSNIKSEELGDN
jgi:MFS family permease